MSEDLRTIILVAEVLTTGISTGVYQLYSFVIMPGLRKTDAKTFVTAFQQIDRTIVGPYLLVFFFGPLILAGAAFGMHLGDEYRQALPWLATALGLNVAIWLITMSINVPLNNYIKGVGDPSVIDVTAVRSRFHESRWLAWNTVRVVASGVAFSSLTWALVINVRA
jgi:uncharacterized membrane protein